jgi:hypothetical protein
MRYLYERGATCSEIAEYFTCPRTSGDLVNHYQHRITISFWERMVLDN